jgi:putative transposase
MGRNATDEACGYLRQHRYVLHDRDSKFYTEFRETLAAGGVRCLRLPARNPNLNAFAERWVRSVQEECLSKLILFGEASLKRALTEFQGHYHAERNHQGKSNKLLFPRPAPLESRLPATVRCQERLGGLLKYLEREAACVSQVGHGTVAFWASMSNEHARTWLPILGSTCLLGLLKCRHNADRSLWMLLAHGSVY